MNSVTYVDNSLVVFKTVFLSLDTSDISGQTVLCCGAGLHILRYLMASLAPGRWRPGVSTCPLLPL